MAAGIFDEPDLHSRGAMPASPNGEDPWLVGGQPDAVAPLRMLGTRGNAPFSLITNSVGRVLVDATGSIVVGAGAVEPSALVAMVSTTQGLLPPRMSSVQRLAIPAPATGLLVFDTTTGSYHYYTGAVWLELAGTAAGVREIRMPIDFSAAVFDSAQLFPATARIVTAQIKVDSAFNLGTTATLGTAAAPAAFQSAAQNAMTAPGLYSIGQDTASGGAVAFRCTIAGAPAAGAGFAIVFYSVPEN